MTDQDLAHTVRAAVAALNDALAQAAHHHLAVTLHTTAHQTAGGVAQTVAEVRIFKQL